MGFAHQRRDTVFVVFAAHLNFQAIIDVNDSENLSHA
jgi:hypothetical protein